MAAKNKSNKLEITRIYDAPVKLVWDAWTDPKQTAQWWGPRGFTITTHSKDLRAGGHWHYTMHGPDGTDWPNKTVYFEVEKYSRLVYDHGGNDTQAPLFRVTVNFTELKGKTKMEMTMELPSPEALEQTKKIIKNAGGNSTWDRLAEYLAKETESKEKFVINRTFDAPIDVMYDMWTNPDHFSKWLPPTGMSMNFIRAEIKPGGVSFYRMTADDKSMTMHGRVHYKELSKAEHKLVYVQEFTDENEKPGRHPGAPNFPASMMTTVQLSAEGADQTRVTVTWEPIGNVSREELETFIQMRAGMTQGWTGSFDKLEDYLSK